jgi:hypothetical protein
VKQNPLVIFPVETGAKGSQAIDGSLKKDKLLALALYLIGSGSNQNRVRVLSVFTVEQIGAGHWIDDFKETLCGQEIRLSLNSFGQPAKGSTSSMLLNVLHVVEEVQLRIISLKMKLHVKTLEIIKNLNIKYNNLVNKLGYIYLRSYKTLFIGRFQKYFYELRLDPFTFALKEVQKEFQFCHSQTDL